jgi:predicted dehydrogenase
VALVRIGVVGAGGVMQRVHLPSLRQLAEVDVVALAELDLDLGRRVAAAFGIPRVHPSVEEMVAQEQLDGVVVVTNKAWHCSACLPALERGLPVFTEKPLAGSLEDGRRMVETAARTGARLMVGYMKRYDPAVREAERLLREGALGPVRYARVHDFGGEFVAGAEGVATRPLRPQPPRRPSPQGPSGAPPAAPSLEQVRAQAFDQWIEVWIHDVNLVQGLFGPVEELIWSRQGASKLALVRCGGGAEVLLEVGGPQVPGAPWDEAVEAFGPSGRLQLRFAPPFLLHAPTELRLEDADQVRHLRTGYAEAFTEELRSFCRLVAEGGLPETDGAMGLRDMEVCALLVEMAHPAR